MATATPKKASTAKSDKARQPRGLSEKQHIAIRALVAGKSDGEAAGEAETSRQVVNEWKNNNPLFIQELSEKRAEAWNAYISPLREAVKAAIDTVHTEIRRGDIKAAMWLLDKMDIQEQLQEELDSKKARPRTLENVVEVLASERARKRLDALQLNPMKYLEHGEAIHQQYADEELARLKREYSINE